jgi:hypothetical protein
VTARVLGRAEELPVLGEEEGAPGADQPSTPSAITWLTADIFDGVTLSPLFSAGQPVRVLMPGALVWEEAAVIAAPTDPMRQPYLVLTGRGSAYVYENAIRSVENPPS